MIKIRKTNYYVNYEIHKISKVDKELGLCIKAK